jgi:hypothetical protein
VYFPRGDVEIDPFQDLFAFGFDLQILDIKHRRLTSL